MFDALARKMRVQPSRDSPRGELNVVARFMARANTRVLQGERNDNKVQSTSIVVNCLARFESIPGLDARSGGASGAGGLGVVGGRSSAS